MIEVDFFAPRQAQVKALRKLSDRKLAAFEKEISQTPPYSPDSPLRKLVVKERLRRARAPKRRLSVRSVLTALTKRRRRK